MYHDFTNRALGVAFHISEGRHLYGRTLYRPQNLEPERNQVKL